MQLKHFFAATAFAAFPVSALLIVPTHVRDGAVTLSVEGRASANPWISAAGQFVAVAFSSATTNEMDIYVATSRDGGITFSKPSRVNRIAGQARVNGEMPPRVLLVPRKGNVPEMVVVWTAKAANDWQLFSARSTDGGATFGASIPVPGSEAMGSRGWESATVDASGKVSVMWLDHRDAAAADAKMKASMPAPATPAPAAAGTAAPIANMHAAPAGDPTERAALSKLYFASLDSKSAIQITPSVCWCCKTSVVASGKNVYAVWRHVFPGSMRDMAFSVSRDAGKTFSAPVRVARDNWKIDGCPDNGPSLTVDRTERTHVVWPAMATGSQPAVMGIFYANTADGKTFSSRVQIPTRGSAGHPVIILGTDGTPLVTWDETVDGTRRVGIARVKTDAAGKVSFVPVAAPDAGPGQWYPVLASTDRNTLAAWVRQNDKSTNVVVAPLQ